MRRLPTHGFWLLGLFLAVAAAPSAQAQSGIACRTGDGRQIFMEGATACPLGLSPVTAPAASPAPGGKAAAPVGSAVAPQAPQDFRCPDRGSLFTYATLSDPPTVIGERIALGRDGLSCFYFVRAQANSPYADSQYYAGFWRVLSEAEQKYVQQLAPAKLWPLAVGKTAEGQVQASEGTTRVRIAVERLEAVDLPMGRVPAYVVSIRETVGDGAQPASEHVFWWSPDLGEAVKFTAREKDGTTSGWQVVSAGR